ncbi:MAG: class I SAM-dependent methyltransferase [Bacteroidetes bacterium]|nr:class I SAM-dependent methyltransferase [Bacteroidota bacterium]
MGLKKFLQKIYLWPLLPPERVNFYQEKIRRAEWEAVKPFIKPHSSFLDVGCGAGYNLRAAAEELHCAIQGIDPQPGAHGVGRYSSESLVSLPVDQGVAEKLPYADEQFDVVFSSHVLEHVNSIPQSLYEMKRVLKEDGTLIIGMPTSAMALTGMITQIVLTTHMRWYEFLRQPSFSKMKFLFLPHSHSKEDRTVLYDVINYTAAKWESHLSDLFVIRQRIFPALYPYPDFRQPFNLKKLKNTGSSVFFICSKKA